MNRRHFMAAMASAIAAASLTKGARADTPKEVRIGLQKNGVILVARQQRAIEKALEPISVKVTWHEFQFGPPLLEALNAGAIDFGTTGDAPPIFAQAARANLYYVAAHGGAQNAVIVPERSLIKTVADLKGKKVAFGKGSSAHSLLLAALENGGITFADIEPSYLAPADAGAAFARGSVDAWSIWDPFLAVAEKQQTVRIIARSDDTYPALSFYLANKDFADKYPAITGKIADILSQVTEWTKANQDEAARLFAEATNVAYDAQRKTVERTRFSISPVTGDIVKKQQTTADRYFKLGLMPKQIDVSQIVWTWNPGS
ncbi:MAG: aliphatic sulfonate ABC transporter substrate-binding protein [Chitinophagales bacterium]|nr:aliphatic sulfonate ABC transporter substrate-binding protein [Hyphomicrobiales bacterium]